MRRILFFIILLIILAVPSCAGQSVTFASRSVCGTVVNVIIVDLADANVRVVPALASGFRYESRYADESFASMIGRYKPVAAINGTFFDKYTLKPVGSIVADGKLVHSGGIGSAFCIKTDGSTEFKQISGTDGRRIDWSGVQSAMCSGPTLLINGKNVLNPASEGFRDPHVYARSNRSASGVTADRKLLLVTMPRGAALKTEVQIMKALGCVNAINLDGGASSALYYRGKYINSAGRKLTNVLLVYENGQYPRDKMQWPAIAPSPALKNNWSSGKSKASEKD